MKTGRDTGTINGLRCLPSQASLSLTEPIRPLPVPNGWAPAAQVQQFQHRSLSMQIKTAAHTKGQEEGQGRALSSPTPFLRVHDHHYKHAVEDLSLLGYTSSWSHNSDACRVAALDREIKAAPYCCYLCSALRHSSPQDGSYEARFLCWPMLGTTLAPRSPMQCNNLAGCHCVVASVVV